jgi:hypothetical protein
MTCSGEVRSPLEASVQELCNARLVEVSCTWTNARPQFPPENFLYRLLPGEPPRTSIRRQRNWRSQTNPSPSSGKVVLDKSNLHETTCPIDLRSRSIAGTSRKSAKDSSWRCASWGSRESNSFPSRQSLPLKGQSREAARFSILATALRVLAVRMRSNRIARTIRRHHVRHGKTARRF